MYQLGKTALVSELTNGGLSLSVYLASFYALGCTMMGVNVMDISEMIEWCGGVLAGS